MKTVQGYLELGLAFVDGDIFDDDGEYEYSNAKVESFAWRNNDGVKPEYKGLAEYVLNSGQTWTAYVGDIAWLRGFGYSVAKWRPVVLQSESPAVSLKEDKPMKPVYTAEMHARNELPPVGADFNIEGWDGVPCTMTGIGRDNVLFIYKKNEYTIGIKDVSFKPIIKTIKVNGFDVPAPTSEAPMINDKYFTPQTGYEVFYCANKWRGDKFDSRFLSRGLVHSTESSAIAHAKAMLGIDPNA